MVGSSDRASCQRGFYQPALGWLGSTAVLGGVRLTCPLSGATREGLVEYNQRYRRNANPEIQGFELVRADGTVTLLDASSTGEVRPQERVTLRVSWPECPSEPLCGDGICGTEETSQVDAESGSTLIACPEDCASPRGCGGAEHYISYDHLAQRVIRRQESIVVSWYSTGGSFEAPRTDSGSGSTPSATSTENRFTLPASGEVLLWAVARDDRGGVTWTRATLIVAP